MRLAPMTLGTNPTMSLRRFQPSYPCAAAQAPLDLAGQHKADAADRLDPNFHR